VSGESPFCECQTGALEGAVVVLPPVERPVVFPPPLSTQRLPGILSAVRRARRLTTPKRPVRSSGMAPA